MTTGLSDIESQNKQSQAPGGAGLLITRAASLVRAQVEAQIDRWMLWAPVALGAGAAAYLALPREPLWQVAVLPALFFWGLAIGAMRMGRRRWTIPLVLMALAATGLAAGKLRTMSVDAPISPATEAVRITGWVVDVASPGQSGGRLIIAPSKIGGLAPADLPKRIRVTSAKGLIEPGAAVAFTGLINPPPPPAAPGAYDFARNAYFDRIGGVGVALTEPRRISLQEADWRTRLAMRINALRWSLAEKIAAAMGPKAAGLGAAMVTGHEAFMSQTDEDALRDAGLAHIISISGLHMAIVGGFAFFLVRTGVSAWPWLALRINGKKAAAVFGLIAVVVYLAISGSPPPAERAAITAAVAFGAILADRRAISLHSLAVAAMAVIALQPEAVGEAGFQMSFAATAALVALAERWTRPPREINTPLALRIPQGIAVWIGVSLGASLVAGLATAPFAIQHFNRVAVWGLPANLVTGPLSTFVIMPFLAMGAVLETVGLGGPFLKVAGLGIEWLNAAASWVAAQPHAVILAPSAPAAALPVAFLGILWLCLWRGKLRWLGLPAALAIVLWPRPEAPLAWIAPDGAAAGLRRGGEAVLMRPDEKLFAAELWANRRGLPLPADGAAARDALFDCMRTSCRATYDEYPRISAWWTVRKPKPEILESLCASSDILALKAKVDLPASCNRVRVLTPADFAASGAVEIYQEGRMVWAQPIRGQRPWTRVSRPE